MPELEQAPIEMEQAGDDTSGEDSGDVVEEKRREKGERGKADGKQKDCFAFGGGGGGGGGGGSNTGSSSSESEVEQQDRQRQIDQWNLKRPSIMEPHADAGKRQRNT